MAVLKDICSRLLVAVFSKEFAKDAIFSLKEHCSYLNPTALLLATFLAFGYEDCFAVVMPIYWLITNTALQSCTFCLLLANIDAIRLPQAVFNQINSS